VTNPSSYSLNQLFSGSYNGTKLYLYVFSGFAGPRHSGVGVTGTSRSNPHHKSRNAGQTDSDECESVDSDKGEADVGNNSDFVIDEDYDA